MMPDEEKYNRSKSELLAIITSFMGGRVAEAIIYGADNVSTGASDDIAKATNIARKMVTEWGLSDLGPIKYEEDSSNPFLGRDYMKNSSFSSKVGQEIDEQIRKIILTAEKKAHEIITENRQLLELIKDALIIKETIVAEEIEYIEKHMELPPEMTNAKTELKNEYSEEDFNELFNEVAGQKQIQEDKYKATLNSELKKHNIEDNGSNNHSEDSNDTKIQMKTATKKTINKIKSGIPLFYISPLSRNIFSRPLTSFLEKTPVPFCFCSYKKSNSSYNL